MRHRARLGALRPLAPPALRSRSTARGRSCTPRPPRPCSPPGPGAIRFDAPAAGNRPGRHGIWQRPVERRRMRDAPLLVPWSEGGLAEAPAARTRTRSSCPCRSSPPGPPRSATSPRSPTARTRRRRASTACSPPGRRRGARARAGRRRPGRGRRRARKRAPRTRGMLARAATTGRCCGARGCSCAPRGGRTTGSRSSRRWPTAACSSRPPRRGRTRRCRWRGSSTRGSSAGSREGDPHRARRPARRLRGAGERAAGAVAARGGRRGGARAAAAAVSLAGMTPISGQSVLITGAAHGIGAETARRLAARGARVSLVGLGARSRRVAADCPGSITFEADVTDRDALDAAVSGTVEAFGGDRHACSPTPGSARRASSAAMDPDDVRARHRGQPDRRVAHDPCLPAARHRAPRLRPPGRVDGRDPARRSGSAPTGRRSRASRALGQRAARGDRSTTASTSASPTSRGSTPRWSAAPTAPSSARACAPCSTGPLGQAPTR